MKKKILKFVGVAFAVPLFLSSCVVAMSHQVTGNPVGTKEGYVKSSPVAKDNDIGIAAAAKKGGITKIATVDIKYFASGKIAVTVTGE
jgi:hypothetical protein